MSHWDVFWGVVIPFIGTSAGAALVFLMKKELGSKVERILTGFAAGIMTAASVWSLLIPSIEQATSMENWAFVPAAAGFLIGMFFLLFLDEVTPHLHRYADKAEGPKAKLPKHTMMLLAVTLHNIPEGMAVGIIYAAAISGTTQISGSAALALALGIAIQNFPEGAIVSMPLKADGDSKGKAFLGGVLSGAVEPLAALLTIFFAHLLVPVMPYLLSFAAGAMMYVVVEELIPEMSAGEHSNWGVISFALGFAVMMILDVALG